MRLRVMNRGVMIDQLRVAPEVQSVHRAFATLCVEHRNHVIPRDRSAERNRMRQQIAVSLLIALNRRNVKSAQALVLNLAMLQPRILFENQLSHDIREMRLIANRDILLDYLGIASGMGCPPSTRGILMMILCRIDSCAISTPSNAKGSAGADGARASMRMKGRTTLAMGNVGLPYGFEPLLN